MMDVRCLSLTAERVAESASDGISTTTKSVTVRYSNTTECPAKRTTSYCQTCASSGHVLLGCMTCAIVVSVLTAVAATLRLFGKQCSWSPSSQAFFEAALGVAAAVLMSGG